MGNGVEKNLAAPGENVCRVRAEQFFSGKNPAVFASQNPRIFPLASAKNSQKYPSAIFPSAARFFFNAYFKFFYIYLI